VRVIDDEGQQVGIMPPYEALKMAREKSLDLVRSRLCRRAVSGE